MSHKPEVLLKQLTRTTPHTSNPILPAHGRLARVDPTRGRLSVTGVAWKLVNAFASLAPEIRSTPCANVICKFNI